MVDLGKLKLEAAKSLTLSIVRRRNGHDGTEESQEAFSVEEAMSRLDDIELRLAQLIDLEGGLDGVSQLIQDVEVLKMRMNVEVSDNIPN